MHIAHPHNVSEICLCMLRSLEYYNVYRYIVNLLMSSISTRHKLRIVHILLSVSMFASVNYACINNILSS